MAQKLFDQDEAARLLSVSVDELNSMRDRKQIFPKRDGGTWKYNQDEIDRVLRDREAGGSGSWGDSLSLEDVSLELNSDPDSILLTDSNIGDADDNPSTIIGRTKETPASESDVLIAGMRPPRAPDKGTSDSALFAEMSSMSDVRLASESGISLDHPPKTGGSVIAGTGMGSGLLDDLVLEPTGSSGKLLGSGSLRLADEELKLGETDSDRRLRGVESDTKKGGSAIRLADDDDDLVLGGKSGSDISIGGDSGISLVDPHDSGLSLEEPLELESSNVESLDLGEDDMISLEEDVDLEGATQLRSDADFLLTPMDDGVDESDSGSQVIALDADEDFGAGFGSSPGMLEEDLGGSPLGGSALVGGALATGPALMPASYAAPEAPFSVWNVVSLLACVLFLVFGGMFMYDLVRHMWSWGTPYTINSSMMDSLIGMFDK